MTRLLRICLLVGLAVPAIASAQGSAVATAGVARGSVIELDLPAGTLRIQAGRSTMTLEGTPAQLVGLNPGDVVEFPYVNYDGNLWLSPQVGSGRSELYGTYANQGRIVGTVQAMDLGRGQLTVQGVRFRVHPALLQNIQPGMFVTVEYTDVGGVSWAAGVRPMHAADGTAAGA